MADENRVKSYKTVYRGGRGEIVEKKSRFIAHVAHVESEEEALAFVEKIKKEYWDARHNCHAFTVGILHETARCSDDGEPSQTAGKPMMDVLTGAGLTDVAVVVTRYFGGTLLGTGGLVRAYSGAVQEGLKNSTVITKYLGVKLSVTTDYNGVGKLQYLFGQKEIPILSAEYTDKVVFTVLVESSRIQEIKKAITEATSATAQMKESDPVYFAEINGKFTVM